MKKNKKIFNSKNKIILTDGSTLNIFSSKFVKNYQITEKIVKKNLDKKKVNKNKSNFITNIFIEN